SNINGHGRTLNNNNLAYDQREGTRSMPIGEMMERARLSAMNINNSRSQSPTVANSAMSSQFMDAIQRSDQIPIVDNHHQQNRVNQTLLSSSSPTPLDT
ncbi:unnamed protein product, partial [Rotaria socialis]